MTAAPKPRRMLKAQAPSGCRRWRCPQPRCPQALPRSHRRFRNSATEDFLRAPCPARRMQHASGHRRPVKKGSPARRKGQRWVVAGTGIIANPLGCDLLCQRSAGIGRKKPSTRARPSQRVSACFLGEVGLAAFLVRVFLASNLTPPHPAAQARQRPLRPCASSPDRGGDFFPSGTHSSDCTAPSGAQEGSPAQRSGRGRVSAKVRGILGLRLAIRRIHLKKAAATKTRDSQLRTPIRKVDRAGPISRQRH